MLRQHARINMHYFRRPCHVGGGLVAHAIWLYIRFTLSFRDVEDLLAERGTRDADEATRARLAR
jgi:transposase-like protein